MGNTENIKKFQLSHKLVLAQNIWMGNVLGAKEVLTEVFEKIWIIFEVTGASSTNWKDWSDATCRIYLLKIHNHNITK